MHVRAACIDEAQSRPLRVLFESPFANADEIFQDLCRAGMRCRAVDDEVDRLRFDEECVGPRVGSGAKDRDNFLCGEKTGFGGGGGEAVHCVIVA